MHRGIIFFILRPIIIKIIACNVTKEGVALIAQNQFNVKYIGDVAVLKSR